MIVNLKSKSNGNNLILHLKATMKIGRFIANKLKLNDEITRCIMTACLLHDIGKCVADFQRYLDTKNTTSEFIKTPLFHQEIGWAFLCSVLNVEDNKFILHSVYWHHPKPQTNGVNNDNYSDILSQLDESDLLTLIELYNYLTDCNLSLTDINYDKTVMAPSYYYNEKKTKFNPVFTLIDECVVISDRIVSSFKYNQDLILSDDAYCVKIVTELGYKMVKKYTTTKGYNIDRFNKQVQYANLARNKKTSIMKAPSGFGKTLLGILWSLSSDRRLIWVCPRNAIVESVYDSILIELSNLTVDVSVELYLTGNRKKATDLDLPDFMSDIVVTNIDNYLSPTLNNHVKGRLFDITYCDVVFDEFHELVNDEALFASFINIMCVRHRFVDCSTLLLSATPIDMSYLWNLFDGEKTSILPNEENHYNAAHEEKYQVRFVDEINDIVTKDDTLTVLNSISNAQETLIAKNEDVLIHGNFMSNDKIEIFENIFGMYGKNQKLPYKKNVVSGPIIQSSMDLSFMCVIMSLFSPEMTLQLWGRCYRWFIGNGLRPVVYLYDMKQESPLYKSEMSVVRQNYDFELRNSWINFLKKEICDGDYISLNQLYTLYNKFNTEFNSNIRKYIDRRYINSITKLSNMFPYRPFEKNSGKKGGYKSSKPKLRGGGDMYCIYEVATEKDVFTDPFSVDYVRDVERGEDIYTERKFEYVIKILIKNKDPRFKYNDHVLFKKNRLTLNKIRSEALNIETPYIAFDKLYDKKYGLIKKSIYAKVIK